MQFESANPSVVRSVKQRELLECVAARGLATATPLPGLRDYRPDRIADELADMMGFDVAGSGDSALPDHPGRRTA